jgi:hypothetical protein
MICTWREGIARLRDRVSTPQSSLRLGSALRWDRLFSCLPDHSLGKKWHPGKPPSFLCFVPTVPSACAPGLIAFPGPGAPRKQGLSHIFLSSLCFVVMGSPDGDIKQQPEGPVGINTGSNKLGSPLRITYPGCISSNVGLVDCSRFQFWETVTKHGYRTGTKPLQRQPGRQNGSHDWFHFVPWQWTTFRKACSVCWWRAQCWCVDMEVTGGRLYWRWPWLRSFQTMSGGRNSCLLVLVFIGFTIDWGPAMMSLLTSPLGRRRGGHTEGTGLRRGLGGCFAQSHLKGIQEGSRKSLFYFCPWW